jgi:hypothetical protein
MFHEDSYSLLINVKVLPHNLIGSNTGTKYATKMGPDAMIYILSQLLSGYRQDIDWLSDLLNITTSNYDSLSELHIPKITVTTAHIKSSQSAVCLVKDPINVLSFRAVVHTSWKLAHN